MAEIPFAVLLHHWATWLSLRLPAPFQARQIRIEDDEEDEEDRGGIQIVEAGNPLPIMIGIVSRETFEDATEVLGNDILHEQIIARRITSLGNNDPIWCFAAHGPNQVAFYQCFIHGMGRVDVGDFDVTMRRAHTAATIDKSTDGEACQQLIGLGLSWNIRLLNAL